MDLMGCLLLGVVLGIVKLVCESRDEKQNKSRANSSSRRYSGSNSSSGRSYSGGSSYKDTIDPLEIQMYDDVSDMFGGDSGDW